MLHLKSMTYRLFRDNGELFVNLLFLIEYIMFILSNSQFSKVLCVLQVPHGYLTIESENWSRYFGVQLTAIGQNFATIVI